MRGVKREMIERDEVKMLMVMEKNPEKEKEEKKAHSRK